MRRRRLQRGRKARGIAEIVGTLMLILIVVAAAIALAAFVASYQKQLQAEESQAQQRSLESLKILSITPQLSDTVIGQWSGVFFVLASEYINPSAVDAIAVNGQPVHFYWVENLSSPSSPTKMYDSTNASNPLILAPHEEVQVYLDLVAPGGANPYYSFFDQSFVLTTTDYIEISLYTALQNTFTQVFLPPTALAVVSSLTTLTDGNYVTEPVLDGSNSFAPTNGTIVDWNWTVTSTPLLVSTSPSVSEDDVSQADSPVSETGTASFTEPTGFVTGDGISLQIDYNGTGTGEITPGSLAISSQSASGGTVTVNYDFTYTVNGAGDSGTISATQAELAWTTSTPSETLTVPTGGPTPGSYALNFGSNPETGSVSFAQPSDFVSGTAISLTVGPGSASGYFSDGPVITGITATGTTITVDYSFTYNDTEPTTGPAGTLSITSASLTYSPLVVFTASGEKVEPAYWASDPSGTIFDIELTVVNSNGLFAVTQISYTNP